MTLLRHLLVKLRSWYYSDDRAKVLRILLIVFGASTLVGFALDIFIPFNGLWNIARSATLIPLAASAFMLGYMASLFFKDRRKASDPRWIPLRQRYSPRRRLQVAIVLGAVLAVGVYALAPVPGYTLLASLIMAAAVGLATFARKTHKETQRDDLGIPDSRDAAYYRTVEDARRKREERVRSKENARKIRKERVLRGRKAAEALEREIEDE